jgi:hypothetical protein
MIELRSSPFKCIASFQSTIRPVYYSLCAAPHTPVLVFDGRITPVETILACHSNFGLQSADDPKAFPARSGAP